MKQSKRGRPVAKGEANLNFGSYAYVVRNARLSSGLGLKDIAQRTGVSVQFVSNIEHGRAPIPLNKMTLFADALNLKVGVLVLAAVERLNDKIAMSHEG